MESIVWVLTFNCLCELRSGAHVCENSQCVSGTGQRRKRIGELAADFSSASTLKRVFSHSKGFGAMQTWGHKTVLWKVSPKVPVGLCQCLSCLDGKWEKNMYIIYCVYIYICMYITTCCWDILRAYSLFSRLCTVGPYRSFPGISISESPHVAAVLSRAEARKAAYWNVVWPGLPGSWPDFVLCFCACFSVDFDFWIASYDVWNTHKFENPCLGLSEFHASSFH